MKRYSSTTKGNYHHTSRKSKKLWLTVSALVIGLGLIFPWFISVVSAVVLYPFHATSTWVKTSDGLLPVYLRSRETLVNEVEKLRTEIATQSGTQLSIRRLMEENIQLRGMANAASTDQERLVARVLARPGQLSYDLLQIDRGASSGVVVGAPVYTGVDSILGIVVQVYDNYSFVDLFTSPGFESTAFIFGPNVFSPIEGIGGGVARVRLPQGVSIEEGQLVILPGVSNGIYGEIARVENEPTQPEQYGYITPPLAINNLLYVSVGLSPVVQESATSIDETIRTMLRDSMRLSTSTLMEFSTSSPVFLDTQTEDVEVEEEVTQEGTEAASTTSAQ